MRPSYLEQLDSDGDLCCPSYCWTSARTLQYGFSISSSMLLFLRSEGMGTGQGSVPHCSSLQPTLAHCHAAHSGENVSKPNLCIENTWNAIGRVDATQGIPPMCTTPRGHALPQHIHNPQIISCQAL